MKYVTATVIIGAYAMFLAERPDGAKLKVREAALFQQGRERGGWLPNAKMGEGLAVEAYCQHPERTSWQITSSARRKSLPTKSVSLSDRKTKLLRHVGLYRVTTRPAVLASFSGYGRTALQNDIRDLRAKELLQSHVQPPGQPSLYQLTSKGATSLGLPASRGTAFGPQALLVSLAVLRFCCFGGRKRHRLEAEEVRTIIGAVSGDDTDVPDKAYCLEWPNDEKSSPKLCELYVPDVTTKVENVERHVIERVRWIQSSSVASRAAETKEYAFAVLVDTETRRQALNALLRGAIAREFPSSSLVFFVEVVGGEPPAAKGKEDAV